MVKGILTVVLIVGFLTLTAIPYFDFDSNENPWTWLALPLIGVIVFLLDLFVFHKTDAFFQYLKNRTRK